MKFFLLPVIAFALVACTRKDKAHETDDKVVTTVGMIADVARQIGGDDLEIINLIGADIDPHSYQPSGTDVEKIKSAGLVLYNGLFLEGKMGTTLESRRKQGHATAAVAEDLQDVSLIGESNHPDPHLWMDVRIWSKVAGRISRELEAFDPENSTKHQANLHSYLAKLAELEAYARRTFPTIPESQRVLVTAHDAFSYLGRAYGIEVRGIQGISTESEAGTKDINDLVNDLVEKKIPAIFIESSVSEKSVLAVIEGAAQQGHTVKIGGKLFSDAMGSPGTYEGTYLGMMDHNITTIVRALGGNAPEKGLHGKLR